MIKESFQYTAGQVRRTIRAGNECFVTSLDIPKGKVAPLEAARCWWQSVLQGCEISGCFERPLKTVDLFSSVGGLSLGAKLAANAMGFEFAPIAALDLDADALNVYRKNFENVVTHHVNVAACFDYHVYGRGTSASLAYPPEVLDISLAHCVGETDLLLAGPPCQGHSNLNNHTRRSDPRNQLYVLVAATAIALQAKMVVIENVPEVDSAKTAVVSTTRRILEEGGYHVSQGLLTASDFGGAQTRKRHFTIATLSPHVALAESTHALSQPTMRLRDVIADLEHNLNQTIMDEVPLLSVENRARIDYLFDNDLYDLPDAVRPDSHKNGNSYPSVYGRLHWDKPAPTITTGFITPGRGRHIHPSQRRVITPREAARIQGFPDSFSFQSPESAPSRKMLAKWIGDAVPTQLGYVAVLTALSSLRSQ